MFVFLTLFLSAATYAIDLLPAPKLSAACEKLLSAAEADTLVRIANPEERAAIANRLGLALVNRQSVNSITNLVPGAIGQAILARLREEGLIRWGSVASYETVVKWVDQNQPAPDVKATSLAQSYGESDPSKTCFAPGTLVLTPQGERAIEDLRGGDEVLSIDPGSKAIVTNRVRKIHLYKNGDKAQMLTRLGFRVEANPRHHFYVPELNSYVPMIDLKPQSSVLVWEQNRARVDFVTELRAQPGFSNLIDLELEAEPHNFLANGIMVHNKPRPKEW
jgi:hypothetical protein